MWSKWRPVTCWKIVNAWKIIMIKSHHKYKKEIRLVWSKIERKFLLFQKPLEVVWKLQRLLWIYRIGFLEENLWLSGLKFGKQIYWKKLRKCQLCWSRLWFLWKSTKSKNKWESCIHKKRSLLNCFWIQ